MCCSPIKALENNWRKSISSSLVSSTIGLHDPDSPAGNKGNPLAAWRPISLCHRSLKCNSLRGNSVWNLSRLHSGSNVLQQSRRGQSITLTDNSGYLVFLLPPHFSIRFAEKIRKPLNRKKKPSSYVSCCCPSRRRRDERCFRMPLLFTTKKTCICLGCDTKLCNRVRPTENIGEFLFTFLSKEKKVLRYFVFSFWFMSLSPTERS